MGFTEVIVVGAVRKQKCITVMHTNVSGFSQECGLYTGDFTFSFLVYGSTEILKEHFEAMLIL